MVIRQKDAKYKNVYCRDKLFNELAVQLKIPLEKVKQRWKTLRDKFHREIKKATGTSGSEATSPKKEWKWLEPLVFLKDVDSVNKRTVGNYPKIDAGEEDFFEDFEFLSYGDTQTSESSVGTSTSRTPTSRTPTSRTPTSKKCSNVDSALESATKEMVEMISLAKTTFAVPQPPESPAQFFFKGIAAQVGQANISPMRFAQLQMEVLSVVTQNLYRDE